MLAADLLQTEDVRIQANQLRPQDGYALLKAGKSVAPIVKVHEVESSNAQLDRHVISSKSLSLMRIIFAVEVICLKVNFKIIKKNKT